MLKIITTRKASLLASGTGWPNEGLRIGEKKKLSSRSRTMLDHSISVYLYAFTLITYRFCSPFFALIFGWIKLQTLVASSSGARSMFFKIWRKMHIQWPKLQHLWGTQTLTHTFNYIEWIRVINIARDNHLQ